MEEKEDDSRGLVDKERAADELTGRERGAGNKLQC